MPAPANPPCPQPGCNGVIDGEFCTICGLEPAEAASAVFTSATGRDGSSRMGTRGTRGTRGTTRATSRRQLGLGLVQVPELPPLDPASVILADPSVPEGKRFCPHCEQKLSREKGFCPKCGKSYSFIPTLKAGEIVADQYEVLGAMAFGGLGWIYLAKDRALSRWVVLKGLLNAQDASSAAAAVAERQFLAAVKHANIVGVYNFVERGTEGYIVMEFVRGKTLRAMRKERGPLPPSEAIAYIHRVLGAFAYLHRQEPPLIYCDFKPENVMLEGDDVKLIDLGAVRREDDPGGEVYGTKGYSAPESGKEPSVASDLFTVARTLAVLTTEFRGFQGNYKYTLPPPDEQPIFARHESLYRFLLKATRRDPNERFASADEMAEQLAGVLREIVAAETGTPRPVESTLFGSDALSAGDFSQPTGVEAARWLPPLKLDPGDPAAAFLLMNANTTAPLQTFAEAVTKFPESSEARLRLARALIETGEYEKADATLADIAGMDWRVSWCRGAKLLLQNHPADAARQFELVYGELPGELAPKLALGLALELADDIARAAALYDLVSRTDAGVVSAVFGLARCQLKLGQVDQAANAYLRVPPTSQSYARAQIALARTWLTSTGEDQIARAAGTVEALALEGQERHRLTAEILQRALIVVEAQKSGKQSAVKLFGQPMESVALRRGLENSLRSLARLATESNERIRLVDLANQVRPRTWI